MRPPLRRRRGVGQIRFVQDHDALFSAHHLRHVGIPACARDPRVKKRHNDVRKLQIIAQHAFRLCHMPGIPLDLHLEVTSSFLFGFYYNAFDGRFQKFVNITCFLTKTKNESHKAIRFLR